MKKATAITLLLAVTLGLGTATVAQAQVQGSQGTGYYSPKSVDENNGPATGTAETPSNTGGMNDGVKAALGCGVAATGSMAATYIAGPSEIIMLWGGGLLGPGSSMMVALAVLGQIGASMCAVGAIATPTVLWAYDQSDNIAAKVFRVSGRIGQQILEASTRAGASVLTTFGFAPVTFPQVAENPATF